MTALSVNSTIIKCSRIGSSMLHGTTHTSSYGLTGDSSGSPVSRIQTDNAIDEPNVGPKSPTVRGVPRTSWRWTQGAPPSRRPWALLLKPFQMGLIAVRSDFQCSIDTTHDKTDSRDGRRLLIVDTHLAVPEPIANNFPHTPGSF